MIYDVRVEIAEDYTYCILTIAHDGRVIGRHSDYYLDYTNEGPTFDGSLKWIAPALHEAYKLGVKDGEITLRDIDKDRGT